MPPRPSQLIVTLMAQGRTLIHWSEHSCILVRFYQKKYYNIVHVYHIILKFVPKWFGI